jgi:hypothetical protein
MHISAITRQRIMYIPHVIVFIFWMHFTIDFNMLNSLYLQKSFLQLTHYNREQNDISMIILFYSFKNKMGGSMMMINRMFICLWQSRKDREIPIQCHDIINGPSFYLIASFPLYLHSRFLNKQRFVY